MDFSGAAHFYLQSFCGFIFTFSFFLPIHHIKIWDLPMVQTSNIKILADGNACKFSLFMLLVSVLYFPVFFPSFPCLPPPFGI